MVTVRHHLQRYRTRLFPDTAGRSGFNNPGRASFLAAQTAIGRNGALDGLTGAIVFLASNTGFSLCIPRS
jgi:hypothetical protein